METNRLSTLEIVLIAVCGGLTAVVSGLAARLCILRKQRSARFVSFSQLVFLKVHSFFIVHGCKQWEVRLALRFLSKPIILWVYIIKDHEISFPTFESVFHVTCYSLFKLENLAVFDSNHHVLKTFHVRTIKLLQHTEEILSSLIK